MRHGTYSIVARDPATGELGVAVQSHWFSVGALVTCLYLIAFTDLAFAWSTAAALGAAVPGQLGVVEAALVHSGSALGLALPSLLALALIRRLRALCWLVLGLLLAIRILKRNHHEVSDVSIATA